MIIINKSLQPTVEEALLSLEVKSQCLQFPSIKKVYVRSVIRKIKKENPSIIFKTKVEEGYLNVWRRV